MTATLLATGVSHDSAPLALRERLALPASRAAELMNALAAQPHIDEVVVLSTCNRTELYLLAADPAAAGNTAVEALARIAAVPTADVAAVSRSVTGLDVARHLFGVAAGLRSVVIGEAEVQGQVRLAYELALAHGTSGPITNRLFQDALRAGKRVRSEIGLSRGRASVASVAVDLAERALGELAGRRVLVVGAGKHGELTARRLAERGADTVFVANRVLARAETLAERFGGAAVGFDDLRRELARADLVLTCTACPRRIIGAADLAGRTEPLVIIDTAMPRDVDPAARELPGITVYDLDDIQRVVTASRSARAQQSRPAERIIDQEVESFGRWLSSLSVVPTISALRERGFAAVERALRLNEPRWQALTDDDRERVELVARAVVSDLLHEPTVRLRRAGEGGSSARYVQAVRELFGLST